MVSLPCRFQRKMPVPSLFRLLGFKVYFWSNEGQPLEPIHVHVSQGEITKNATKFWIYRDGSAHLESNGSNLSKTDINRLSRLLEAHSDEIIFKWKSFFDCEPTFKA